MSTILCFPDDDGENKNKKTECDLDSTNNNDTTDKKDKKDDKDKKKKDKDINLIDITYLNWIKIGIPVNLTGYQYLKHAIDIIKKDPTKIGAITKQVYPDIAIKYNTSTKRVEGCIRTAVESTWRTGNRETLDEIFGKNRSKKRPSNTEFIATISEYLNLAEKTKLYHLNENTDEGKLKELYNEYKKLYEEYEKIYAEYLIINKYLAISENILSKYPFKSIERFEDENEEE